MAEESVANSDALNIKPGVERWSIKTGTDEQASQVATESIQGKIAELVSFPAPPDPDAVPDRDTPVELTTYTIDCTLVAYKEESDGDFHLVLSDDSNNTMIAEIPDPDFCAGSVWLEQITEARKTFDDRFGTMLAALAEVNKMLLAAPNTDEAGVAMITHVSIPVTVVGIGFFDRLHGQTGVAPNGVELHPVLSVTFK